MSWGISRGMQNDLGISVPETPRESKLTLGMQEDLGIVQEEVISPIMQKDVQIEEKSEVSPIVETPSKSADETIVQAVRQEQMMQILQAIKSNTERKPWNFPITRDGNGHISSIRAEPVESR